MAAVAAALALSDATTEDLIAAKRSEDAEPSTHFPAASKYPCANSLAAPASPDDFCASDEKPLAFVAKARAFVPIPLAIFIAASEAA